MFALSQQANQNGAFEMGTVERANPLCEQQRVGYWFTNNPSAPFSEYCVLWF